MFLKRLFFVVLGISMLCAHIGFSQSDSSKVKELQEKVKSMETLLKDMQTYIQQSKEAQGKLDQILVESESYKKLMIQQRKADSLKIASLSDSVNLSKKKVVDLESQVNNYKSELNAQSAMVKDVTRRVEITDEARFKLICNNLIYSAELFELINDKLNTLYAISQIESYRSLLANLNNPADESLGFSYNKKVLQLLEQKVQAKKEMPRILEFAKVLIESPTVKAFTSINPILNVGSSLVTYIAELGVSRKDIDSKDVMAFKQEMEKYSYFYVSLNELNVGFASNLGDYQIQTTNMHNKLEEFVVTMIGSAGFKVQSKEELQANSSGEYLAHIFRVYNKESIRNYLKDIEKQNTKNGKVDYAKIFENNKNLVQMNMNIDEVIYFYKQFEFLYGQYISMLDENCKGTIDILKQGKENQLSPDNGKIDLYIESLSKHKVDAIQGIRTAVNIQKIKDVVNLLDEYFPVL